MSYLQNNAQYAPGMHPAVETETRRRWAEERDAGNRIPPHPAPEVTARPAFCSGVYTGIYAEVPRTALSLRVAAEKAGWVVAVTYARGTMRTKTTETVVDSIALRMRHPDGRRAAAIWLDGKASTALVRKSGMFPVSMNVTDAKKWILEPVRHLVLAS